MEYAPDLPVCVGWDGNKTDPLSMVKRAIALGAYKIQLFKPYFNQETVDMAHENGNIAGVTAGLFYGIGYTVARVCVGVADVVTFLIPLPGCADNKYDTGWGYGPMAFHDSPWVVDIEHNWGNFFYDSEDMVSDQY